MTWRDWFKIGFTGFVALSATFSTMRFFQFLTLSQEVSLALSAPVFLGVVWVMIRGFNPRR